MPASSTDLLQKVGLPGSATTLGAPGYTVGNTSITVPTTSNHPTDTGYTFAIDSVEIVNNVEQRVANSYSEFVGIVTSPTTIGAVKQVYGTPKNYVAGPTTRVYIPVSSERENRLVEWGLKHADQQGALLPAAVLNALGNLSSTRLTVPHKFSAVETNGQAVSTNTTIIFNNEDFDTGNNYNNTTGIFTAPVPGFYHFNCNVQFLNLSTQTVIPAFFKNGAPYRRFNRIDNASGGPACFGAILMSLVAGDTVHINAGVQVTPRSLEAQWSYFTGELRSGT